MHTLAAHALSIGHVFGSAQLGPLMVDDLSTMIPAGINFAALVADIASLLTNPFIVAVVLASIAVKWGRTLLAFVKRASSAR